MSRKLHLFIFSSLIFICGNSFAIVLSESWNELSSTCGNKAFRLVTNVPPGSPLDTIARYYFARINSNDKNKYGTFAGIDILEQYVNLPNNLNTNFGGANANFTPSDSILRLPNKALDFFNKLSPECSLFLVNGKDLVNVIGLQSSTGNIPSDLIPLLQLSLQTNTSGVVISNLANSKLLGFTTADGISNFGGLFVSSRMNENRRIQLASILLETVRLSEPFPSKNPIQLEISKRISIGSSTEMIKNWNQLYQKLHALDQSSSK